MKKKKKINNSLLSSKLHNDIKIKLYNRYKQELHEIFDDIAEVDANVTKK